MSRFVIRTVAAATSTAMVVSLGACAGPPPRSGVEDVKHVLYGGVGVAGVAMGGHIIAAGTEVEELDERLGGDGSSATNYYLLGGLTILLGAAILYGVVEYFAQEAPSDKSSSAPVDLTPVVAR